MRARRSLLIGRVFEVELLSRLSGFMVVCRSIFARWTVVYTLLAFLGLTAVLESFKRDCALSFVPRLALDSGCCRCWALMYRAPCFYRSEIRVPELSRLGSGLEELARISTGSKRAAELRLRDELNLPVLFWDSTRVPLVELTRYRSADYTLAAAGAPEPAAFFVVLTIFCKD